MNRLSEISLAVRRALPIKAIASTSRIMLTSIEAEWLVMLAEASWIVQFAINRALEHLKDDCQLFCCRTLWKIS